MTEQAMSTPTYPGDAPRPKRNGARGLLPSTWIGRTLRIEYVDAHGCGQATSGLYLDWTPLGVIVNSSGARTLISWERLTTLELVED